MPAAGGNNRGIGYDPNVQNQKERTEKLRLKLN